MKFTDEEVIKALECCVGDDFDYCKECPSLRNKPCQEPMLIGALDLINRQKAEIERLEEENRRMKKYYFTHDYHECHNEAIKEFAERLKYYFNVDASANFNRWIDKKVKEKTEANDE